MLEHNLYDRPAEFLLRCGNNFLQAGEQWKWCAYKSFKRGFNVLSSAPPDTYPATVTRDLLIGWAASDNRRHLFDEAYAHARQAESFMVEHGPDPRLFDIQVERATAIEGLFPFWVEREVRAGFLVGAFPLNYREEMTVVQSVLDNRVNRPLEPEHRDRFIYLMDSLTKFDQEDDMASKSQSQDGDDVSEYVWTPKAKMSDRDQDPQVGGSCFIEAALNAVFPFFFGEFDHANEEEQACYAAVRQVWMGFLREHFSDDGGFSDYVLVFIVEWFEKHPEYNFTGEYVILNVDVARQNTRAARVGTT